MAYIRTNEEAARDLAARDEMVERLAKSHGLNEYWAEGVYYGECSIEEAIKAQKEDEKRLVESLNTPIPVITTIEGFNKALEYAYAECDKLKNT